MRSEDLGEVSNNLSWHTITSAILSKFLAIKSSSPSNLVFMLAVAAFINTAHSEGEEKGIVRIMAAINGGRIMTFLMRSIDELFLRLENSAAVSNFEKAVFDGTSKSITKENRSSADLKRVIAAKGPKLFKATSIFSDLRRAPPISVK